MAVQYLTGRNYRNTEIHKLCGPPEIKGYQYTEGCDAVQVPIQQEKCYCKGNLCNNSNIIGGSSLFFVTILLAVYYNNVIVCSPLMS